MQATPIDDDVEGRSLGDTGRDIKIPETALWHQIPAACSCPGYGALGNVDPETLVSVCMKRCVHPPSPQPMSSTGPWEGRSPSCSAASTSGGTLRTPHLGLKSALDQRASQVDFCASRNSGARVFNAASSRWCFIHAVVLHMGRPCDGSVHGWPVVRSDLHRAQATRGEILFTDKEL